MDGAAPCLLTAIADALDAVSIASLIVFPFKIPAIKYPVYVSPAAVVSTVFTL